jgi:hypothetical protein
MTISTTSKKLSYITAVQFKESFYEPAPEVGYVFIGNHLPYANDDYDIPTITDSIFDEKTTWDNMYAAKRITGNDVELVIPRVTWTSNTKYKQYDDRVTLGDLLTANTSMNVKPMYVITSQRNVYKCLSNNASANSTVEPSGDYTSSNGNIATSDGYFWKYMYNIKPSNKFFSDDWIPVPTSTSQLDYGVNIIDVVDGELTTIVVDNPGTNYYERTLYTSPTFNVGCSTLTIYTTIDIPFVNISANMSISGVGIVPGTYITSVDTPNTAITLSTPTVAIGGGVTAENQLSLTTRVYVDGDGTGVIATPTISNTNVSKITVSTIGISYSRANSFVYGTGSGAIARPILDMKYGHAYNPARELGASDVMVAVKIGEIDSTEGDLISSNTTFRQYGIMVNPHKYNDANTVTSVNALSVISQTTDVSVIAGTAYALDEFVYQGTSATTANAYGFLISQSPSTNIVKLTNVKGRFVAGSPLIGANTGTSRLVINTSPPTFQPYSGDLLYTENAVKTTRADGQAENIKLIVRF